MKLSELQRLSGLNINTIRAVYYNESNTISYKTIERLCYALDCSVGDLFEYIPN